MVTHVGTLKAEPLQHIIWAQWYVGGHRRRARPSACRSWRTPGARTWRSPLDNTWKRCWAAGSGHHSNGEIGMATQEVYSVLVLQHARLCYTHVRPYP